MNNARTNNVASLALGVILILAGLMFLVGQFLGARFWEAAWPFVIPVPGLLLFVGMVVGGKSAGGLAIPGSIVTTLGLLMLFQNTFNYFESWAYAWALIPTAVGVGMMINGMWSDLPELADKGQKTARIGVVMFAIGFVFFEFVVRIGRLGNGFLGGFLGPLVLIAIGGYLLFSNLVRINREPLPSVHTASTSQPAAPITLAREQTPSDSTAVAAPSAEASSAPPSPDQEQGMLDLTKTPIAGQEKEEIAVL